MLRATEVLRAGLWNAKPTDVVRLDYDRRTRRRIVLTGTGGLSFLLDLAKTPVLAAGDGLRLEDSRIVAVEAAPERLLEIACRDERALARIAWHLGNRHLAAEIGARVVYIRDDHVIAEASAPRCARWSVRSTPRAAPTARAAAVTGTALSTITTAGTVIATTTTMATITTTRVYAVGPKHAA